MLALGIVLIPYPGPGWLVVFAGLAILATLWLLGVFSLVAGWFGVHDPRLDTPFSRLRG